MKNPNCRCGKPKHVAKTGRVYQYCLECQTLWWKDNYAANRDKMIAAATKWKKDNPERIRAWLAAYREKNRLALRGYNTAYVRRWRAKKKQAGVKKFVDVSGSNLRS